MQFGISTILLLAVMASSGNTSASVTFTERTAFQSALSSFVVDDYENTRYQNIQTDDEMSKVVGIARYTTTGFPNHNLVTSILEGGAIVNHDGSGFYYCAGCNGSFVMDFSQPLAVGVQGVGFDYFNADFPQYHAFVTFGDGTTEDYALEFHTWNNFQSSKFFGVTSDAGIRSIYLGSQNGGVTNRGVFGQDNLTVGPLVPQNDVPEPNSAWLLAFGGLAIVTCRRQLPASSIAKCRVGPSE